MREIKFRGKRVDNGEWVYGDIIHCTSGKTYIFPSGDYANESDKVNQGGCLMMFTFEVIPETVGQYTGLKDKNGKEIYDGDIVVFESVFSKDKFVGRVMYYSGYKPILWDSIDLAETNKEDLEVIGNKHENPELMEVNNG